MFWVIQNNIFREQNHSKLMQAINRMEIPHVQVKVIPFYDRIISSDFDSHNYHGNIVDIPEVEINSNQKIMVLGGTSLSRIAKKRGWNPGSFINNNFHYTHWKNQLGSYLLNEESVVDTFENIKVPWKQFFIRPCEDTKDFNGTVTTLNEFTRWRNDEITSMGGCSFSKSQVVASPLKTIFAEYRFFVVDKEIVTYSQYKLGNRLFKSPIVDNEIINFVKKMVDRWQPDRAFVIDIADTPDGYKVIEINNFNSAGFYDCDVTKIINSIENMDF